MQNVQADTEMRQAISGTGKGGTQPSTGPGPQKKD
jgi:hypothetical protein